MHFAKCVGWLDKPRKCQGDPPNGLNFPIYICQVGKLSAQGQVRGFSGNLEEMGKV